MIDIDNGYENNINISNNAEYSFPVTENKILVAKFTSNTLAT